jgi:hypothetical protein
LRISVLQQVRFAGKRAALAERESAYALLDTAKSETRALQAKLSAAEVTFHYYYYLHALIRVILACD